MMIRLVQPLPKLSNVCTRPLGTAYIPVPPLLLDSCLQRITFLGQPSLRKLTSIRRADRIKIQLVNKGPRILPFPRTILIAARAG